MAADNRNILQGLLANTEKAVRRGRKLERTLLKIVSQSEAGSGAEALLKSVQQGMKKLKKDAKEIERSISYPSRTKKTPVESEPVTNPDIPTANPKPSVKRSRKRPTASAEAAPAANAADV
ncbi:hypothetical protein [Microvirga roseola]|uniref:hypothetical protein n=1 Tax=Microvirga roseola TaxID=2883126 RepID=UPI001E462D72|nr:hypothetical protein [Microvirga roseola]